MMNLIPGIPLTQDMLSSMCNIVRAEGQKDIIRLGVLTELLRHQPKDNVVQFPFATHVPSPLDSYRGYYSELAFGYSPRRWGEHNEKEEPNPTVAIVLRWCEEADGKTFEGYKGGDFTMHSGTQIWVSNYGHCDNVAVVSVHEGPDDITVLQTDIFGF